jgi:C-terminal processing protease CtpA/Prc
MHHSGRLAAAACAAQLSTRAAQHQQHALHHSFRAARSRLYRQLRTISAHLQSAAASPAGAAPLDRRQLTAAQGALRAAAALFAAVCLHLGATPAAEAISLASVAEDSLLGLVRTLETQLDGAVAAARGALPAGPASAQGPEARAAAALVDEVYEVVDQNFADARGAGFDPAAWRRLRDAALARPPRDRAAAYSAVRGMLAALRDPYSRFITPEEFGGMMKYDVSGVGLNLGTQQELRAKTGLGPPPPPEPSAAAAAAGGGAGVPSAAAAGGGAEGGGVWVVGLIRGSAAEGAGMRQGDELVLADGAPLAARSPFQVASLLQGADAGEGVAGEGAPAPAPSEVRLTVRHLDGSTQEVALQRAPRPATPSPVVSRLERPGGPGSGGGAVGYVKLRSFDARAQRDVAAAVRRLEAGGAARLTLDLRGNRGGLVSEGVEVARLFLDGAFFFGVLWGADAGQCAKPSQPATFLPESALRGLNFVVICFWCAQAAPRWCRPRASLGRRRPSPRPAPPSPRPRWRCLSTATPPRPARSWRARCATTAAPCWWAGAPTARGSSRACTSWATGRGWCSLWASI